MADTKKYSKNIYSNSPGAVYGLGFIGALIYYITHATSFLMGLLGVIKAILWPAFLIYKVFEVLHL